MGKSLDIKNPIHLGLLGKTLKHSFSKTYFLEKFKTLQLHNSLYSNFELKDESELALFLLDDVFKLDGFNITIPYKETIIPYLDELDETANTIQAVNTVVVRNGKLIGYNTDVYGFEVSLKPILSDQHKRALIFGTGGSSKAVAFALDLLGVNYKYVSRKSESENILEYKDLDQGLFNNQQILINCTPLGTYPKLNECIDIPYQFITKNHVVYDLVYNPEESLFLRKARVQGAKTLNGLAMLQQQAEMAWKIWTD